MNGRRVLSALGIWLVLLVVAVTAGALRESLLTPRIGAQASHVVGTLVVAVVMAGIIAVYVRRGSTLPLAERWWIGIFWLVLTVGFEFLFGRYGCLPVATIHQPTAAPAEALRLNDHQDRSSAKKISSAAA